MTHSLDELYRDLEKAGITVIPCTFEENKSISLQKGKVIGIDRQKLFGRVEERTILIHEEGNFVSGAFYFPYSPYLIRGQAEWRANKAAILMHIPKEELETCFAQGITELWDLAEYFNVTEDFMRMAVDYYREQELAG